MCYHRSCKVFFSQVACYKQALNNDPISWERKVEILYKSEYVIITELLNLAVVVV